MAAEPDDRKGVNKGVNGGVYDNDLNVLAQSGETWPTEPIGVTAELMAQMPQPAQVTIPNSASTGPQRGGNTGTSA